MSETETAEIDETAYLAADVVVQSQQDDEWYVLLIERRWEPYLGLWALPGGHLKRGEDVAAGGRRELLEETGVQVGDLDLVGVYSVPGRDPRGRYVTWVWTVTLDDMPEPTAGDDARKARWWRLRDALAQPEWLAFDHHQVLVDAAHKAIAPPEGYRKTRLQWCWALAGCGTCAGTGEHVVNDHEHRGGEQHDPEERPHLYPQPCECLWTPPAPTTRALDQLPNAHRPGTEESIQR